MERTWIVLGPTIALLAAGWATHGRVADGPLGPIGGAALEGVPAPLGAEPDWQRLAAPEAVEVEVRGAGGARSVTACLLLLDGAPYLSATLAPFKRWHRTALATGEVTLRQDGKRFTYRVRRVDDTALHAALKAAAFARYRSYEFGDGWAGRHLFFLALESPALGTRSRVRPGASDAANAAG